MSHAPLLDIPAAEEYVLAGTRREVASLPGIARHAVARPLDPLRLGDSTPFEGPQVMTRPPSPPPTRSAAPIQPPCAAPGPLAVSV